MEDMVWHVNSPPPLIVEPMRIPNLRIGGARTKKAFHNTVNIHVDRLLHLNPPDDNGISCLSFSNVALHPSFLNVVIKLKESWDFMSHREILKVYQE